MANYSDPIRIWAYGDYVEAANEAVKIYKRDVDPDFEVQITAIAFSELDAHLNAALQAGDPPDIVLLDDEKLRNYLKNEETSSCFVPLNLEVNPVNLNFIPYKMANLTYEGNVYGVPYSVYPVAMYYNRDLLAEYDIVIDDDITWEDFINLAAELRDKSEENTYMLLPPIDADISKILWLSSGFDNSENGLEEGIKTLEIIERLKNERVFYPDPIDSYDDLLALLAEKRIAAIIGCPWWMEELKTFQEAEEGNWCVTRIPKSEIFTKEVGLGGCSCIWINNGNSDELDRVINFLFTTFGESIELARLIAEKHTVPTLVNVADELGDINPGWTPTCSERNAIQFLAKVSEDIPEFYYGEEKVQKISQNLENVSNGMMYWNLSLQEACDYFESFINNVINNDGVDDTPYFPSRPVPPKPPALVRIEITKQPTTKKYAKGESFDPSGMVVTAYYDNGFSQEISNNALKISPTSFKNSGNTSVTISYTERKKTKTANVNVIVWKNLADKSKKNQTELKYECGAGAASVNLFNQRLLFEHPDVSIGINTYEISVSHVYNSLFDGMINLGGVKVSLQTYMGKGFKLNVQQYVVSYGKKFFYLDGVGGVHEFELLNDGTSYYDTNGLGLILTLETGRKVISDDFGNKMIFDSTGRLSRTLSGYNSKIAKNFIYNDKGQLTKIYDDRKSDEMIFLEYDQTTGLLKTMSCKQGGVVKRSISYVYKKVDTDFMLVDIIDERGDSSFAYDAENKMMTYAASKLDKSALKFAYSYGAITEVCAGVINDETAMGAAVQISSANLSMSSSNTKNRNTFSVTESVAKVTNEKDIQLVYYFNSDGVTTSILEANEGDINDLRTLEKQPGVRMMSIDSVSSEKINQQNVYLGANQALTTEDVLKSSFQAVQDYRNEKCHDYKHYICSFWLKLSHEAIENSEAKITIKSHSDSDSSVTEEYRMTIDNTAADSWQLVAIPIQISGNNIESIEIKLNVAQNYKIGDMRLYYSPLTQFYIGNREDGVPLDEITQIKFMRFGTTSYTTRNINQNCYMTEKDLQATYLSRYNGRGYTLSLCDNTEKYLVSDVRLCGQGKEFALDLDNGRARFYQETRSPDEGTSIYGELYFNKDMGGKAFSGICQYTEAVKGETKSSTSTYVDYKGKVTKEVDEYGVETVYEYDDYGNPNKKIIQHPEADEKLIYTMTTEKDKITESTAVSHTETCYDAFFGNVSQVNYRGKDEPTSNMLSTIFNYDVLDRLKSVENNAGGKNSLTYDANGRLSEVRQAGETGGGYKFEYDRFGNLAKTSLVYGTDTSQSLTGKTINYANSTITDYHYRGSDTDYTTTTLDKYGRTVNIKLETGNNIVGTASFIRQGGEYSAQALDESAGAAEVEKMWDSCEQRDYFYSYDDRNNCTGYTTSPFQGVEKGNFSLKMTGENEVTYTAVNELFWKLTTQVTDDSEKLMNPQVTRIRNKLTLYYNQAEFGNTVDYKYDKLGRMNKKTVFLDKGFYDQQDTTVITENVYKSIDMTNGDKIATTLKEKVAHTFNEAVHEYTYEHDERGRITKFTRKKTAGSKTEIAVASYLYDDCDRLKSETLKGSTRTYTYRNDGGLASETCGDQMKYYQYNYYGRLESISGGGENTFAYDKLGNCTNYDGVTLDWERGNLLKKFGEVTYSYNIQGIRFQKTKGNKIVKYTYDGGKLLAESEFEYKPRYEGADPEFVATEKNDIAYLYDMEGIIGFCMQNDRYLYLKDAQGNVLGIVKDNKEVARYEYDAWGNCKVMKPDEEEYTDPGFIGNINPIRWKSRYYDRESGLYYIDGRYYSPLMKQYISAANPETALSNAAVVYGLNLYLLSLTNPVWLLYNEYTIEPTIALVYDPERLSGWELFIRQCSAFWKKVGDWYNNLHWGWKIGIGAGLFVASLAVTFLSGGTLAPLMISFGVGVAASTAMGGAVAWASGGNVSDGLFNGFTEGVFWGGIFSFVGAGVNAIRRIPAYRFLRANGQKHYETRQALRAFRGIPKVTTLQEDTIVYRSWGVGASELGKWSSPINYGSEARSLLSLPAVNTMQSISTFVIPNGTQVLSGIAAPLFGQPGGGIQFWFRLWTLYN